MLRVHKLGMHNVKLAKALAPTTQQIHNTDKHPANNAE